MEPLFFGKDNRIFGVLHEARYQREADVAVILLYPFGQEYMRCHKTFVILARKLGSCGIHCLRFDYSGCGDSAHELYEVDMNDWLFDIDEAIRQVRDCLGIQRIILVGCRLGASQAMLYCQRNPVDGVILWHPVVSGKDYIREITTAHNHWLEGSFAAILSNKDYFEYQGFGINSSLKSNIERVDLLNLEMPADIRTLIIDRSTNMLVKELSSRIFNVQFKESEAHDFWIKGENETAKQLVPAGDIDIIADWVDDISAGW